MIQKEILIDTLNSGTKEIGLTIARALQTKLMDYIELLCKWNAVHNLTAIRDPVAMVKKHLLDSLVLLPYLSAGKIIDVGTGAGLPGIPLAICNPDQTFVLLDSRQKKITFVEHVILSLKVTNASAVCARVERYAAHQFELVISRAFASLVEFVVQSQHLCQSGGKLIAMKGVLDPAEVAAIPSAFTVEKIVPVGVPGVIGARHLIFIAANTKEGVISAK